MKRSVSKLLAYLLVTVMTLSSSMTVLAEGNSTISGNDVIVTETVSDNDVAEDETVVEDETVAEDETVVEDETVTADETVTDDETVNDNETVSDNEMNEEVAGEEFVFPGLPGGYALSLQELEKKESLNTTLNELGDLNEGNDYVAGEVFFTCETLEEAELYASAYGAELKSFADGVAVITLPEEVSVMRAVQAAADTRTVLPAVSPNYYRYAFETDEEIIDVNNYSVSAAAYNDPMLGASNSMYQWHHQVVGSTYAWNNGYTGSGIKVAVLDTGVATHEDLTITGSYNAATASTSGTGDDGSHGTHVSGIIAAKNNNSKGGSGIAPGAVLYNVKVLGNDAEAGTSATLVRGVNKAIEFGVDIINMSLGGVGYSVDEEAVVAKAKTKGIAVFVAAGNDCSMTKKYPAAYPGSIAVAATDTNNSRAYFSNYGSWVKLAAPGVNIYSTVPGGYGIMSGTSQATPVVAGTAAVILSSNPAGLKDKNGNALTGEAKVDALVKIMQSNVIKASGNKIGKGITNLPKVLKLTTIAGTPNQPTFKLTDGTVSKGGTFASANLKIQIAAEGGMTIYYTTDGKTPTYKNGVATGTKYTSAITLSGEVNGKVTGKMTVKAIAVNAAGKVSKVSSATYTFKPLVTDVTIAGLNQVVAGKSITLKAEVTPAWAANKKVTWSISEDSSTTGVSINASTGKITTKSTAKPGPYTVTATSKDAAAKSKTFSVTVIEAPKVSAMVFSSKSVTFEKSVGKTTLNLTSMLTVSESTGATIPNSGNVVWSSSNEAIATVNASGTLTAKTAGKVTITATAADGSGKTAKITVNIVQLAESVSITGSATVARGKTITLKATVGPTTAKDKNVTWSINSADTDGVSIDKNGKVKATANAVAKTYDVTATTAKGISTTKKIKVVDQITSIKFNQKTATIFRLAGKGGAATSVTLPLTITGGYDASSLSITNSAEGVVSASFSGKNVVVKAVGTTTGKATITVKTTDGSNKSAKITVNVINPASNITISPAMGRSDVIAEGKTLQLSSVFETEYGTLDKNSKKVIWTSSNENVATVNAKGVVTAKTGYDFYNDWLNTATITATAADGSGVVATYNIYTEEAITSMSIGHWFYNSTYDEISVNDAPMYAIYCNYNPYWFDEGVYHEVNVEVSNPEIASCFSYWYNDKLYLVVYPYKTGTVTAKVKAVDGSSASASIKVKITN